MIAEIAIVAAVLALNFGLSLVSETWGIRYQEYRVQRNVRGIGWLARIMEYGNWIPMLLAFSTGIVPPWGIAVACAEGAALGARREVRRLIRDEQGKGNEA